MTRIDEYIDRDTLADGTYFSDKLSDICPNTNFAFCCLDAEGSVVLASAGTVLIEVSEDGVNWGTVANGTIDLSLPSYNRPVVLGAIFRFARVTLTGVTATGANQFRLLLCRFT